MAQVLSPLLAKTMKNPAMITWRHSVKRLGKGCPPQKRAISASSAPAVRNRIAENRAMGRLLTAIFENKKLEPHTRQMGPRHTMSFAVERDSRIEFTARTDLSQIGRE